MPEMPSRDARLIWTAARIELWPVGRLVPYDRNPRTHSDEQVAQIAASIARFGFTNPVLVAARRLGLTQVPVVVLDHLTQAERRAYLIADNKLALAAGWDEALLAGELHRLNGEGFDLGLTGFSDAELNSLMAPLDDDASGDADDEAVDKTPEPPRDPVSRPGDLWLLSSAKGGEHRLLCGDSANPDDVARVMAGDAAALCFTSPPYGNQRDYTTGGVGDWDALMRGVFSALPMADDGQVLVNLGLIHRDNEWQPYWQAWLDRMRGQGWRRFGLYVWDQGPGLPGDWNGRLAPAFELVFHFNRQARKPNKTVPCKWAGHVNDSHGGMRSRDGHVGEWTHAGQGVQEMRIPDSVIRITRHKARGIETEHPAVFPVKLPEFVMQAYSDEGDAIYEPFAGSGTTIVAGERTGRRVRAIELAPAYVDVALMRWRQLFPDETIELHGDGRSFDAVAEDRQHRTLPIGDRTEASPEVNSSS